MAFADPQVVTVNAVAQSMSRVGFGTNSGSFRKDDSLYALSIKHDIGPKRTRRVLKLDQRKLASDPFTSGISAWQPASIYIVSDEPNWGYTIAEHKLRADGFLTYLTASTGANMLKLLGGEV